jgi:hypothetical protein
MIKTSFLIIYVLMLKIINFKTIVYDDSKERYKSLINIHKDQFELWIFAGYYNMYFNFFFHIELCSALNNSTGYIYVTL